MKNRFQRLISEISFKKIISKSLLIVSFLCLITGGMYIYGASVATINVLGLPYSRWTAATNNHGFIEFGSFPQSLADGTPGLPSSPDDGETYEVDDVEYLYENGHWYKFEPIKWQILDIDNTAGKESLLLMSESVLESRNYDTQTAGKLLWDGTAGSITSVDPEDENKNAYPALRLYLNSYDSTQSYTYGGEEGVSYSELKYTESSAPKFRDQGFLEKAFTDAEREIIFNDVNKYMYSTNDGSKTNMKNGDGDNDGNYDKVRTLSRSEMYNFINTDTTYDTYGFYSGGGASGTTSNRLGYSTAYSLSNYEDETTSYNDRGTQIYWTISSVATSPFDGFDITSSGTVGNNMHSARTANEGVRPVIRVSLFDLINTGGDGTIDDPYTYETGECGFRYNGGTYLYKDATYAFDISSSGNHSVMAFYFEDVDGGLLLLDSSSPDSIAATFVTAISGYNANGYSTSKGTNVSTTLTRSNYKTKLTQANGRGWNVSSIFVTPWSIIENLSDDQIIKHVVINRPFKLSSANLFFAELKNVEDIDMSKLDTSSAISFAAMFCDCSSLETISFGENFIGTQSATSLAEMFSGCSELTTPIDLTKFDTSKVTLMGSMFNGCANVPSIWFGNTFNTALVTDMSNMFNGCSSLTSLNLGSLFTTPKVKNMSGMFKNCSSLGSNLGLFIMGEGFTNDVCTNFSEMFMGCSSLSFIDFSIFGTAKGTNFAGMFDGCSVLTSIDLSHMNTALATTMSRMFKDCSRLTSIDLSENSNVAVTDYSYMFSGCSNLTDLVLPGPSINTVALPTTVTTVEGMFQNCSSLESIDLTYKTTSSIATASYMFDGCTSLTSVNDFKLTATCKDTSCMFRNCSNLRELEFPTNFAPSPTNVVSMFEGCSRLSEIDLSKMTISSNVVANGANMLKGCPSLSMIKLPKNTWAGNIMIPLPTGYREFKTVASNGVETTYTNNYLPAQNTTSAVYLRCIPNSIDIDGTTYNFQDAYRAWDVSAERDESVMAYYFEEGQEGTGVSEGVIYGGELIFYSTNDTAGNMIEFTDALSYDFDERTIERFNSEDVVITTSNYSNYSKSNTDNFIISSGCVVTPWSIIASNNVSYSICAINSVIFANEINVTNADFLLCGLHSLTEIENLDNLNISSGASAKYMFYNLREIETLDLNEIDMNNFTDISHMFGHMAQLSCLDLSYQTIGSGVTALDIFEGDDELSDIVLPSSVGTTINLPEKSGYAWVGFNGDARTSQKYTSIPQAASGLTNVKFLADKIEIDGKIYNLQDKTYAWDISKDGKGGVMAYYFDEDTVATGEAEGTTYENEIVIIQINPLSQMIDFNDAVYYDESSSSIKFIKNHSSITMDETDYLDYLEPERGYILSSSYRCTPWTILNTFEHDEHPIDKVVIGAVDGNKVVLNKYTEYLFTYLTSVQEIVNLDNLDVSQLRNLSYAFAYTANLDEIIIDGWDLSNLTTMFDFAEESGVKTVKFLGDLNTVKLENMCRMFSKCSNLTTIDFTGIDTSHVDDMSYMFQKCLSLEEVDLSGFDTSSVTDLNFMFQYCPKLKSLDLSNFDTSNVTSMMCIFGVELEAFDYGGSSLKNLNLSSFVINIAARISSFFNTTYDSIYVLNEINVPASIDETLSIKLPKKTGYEWVGYLNGSKTGTTYTYMPDQLNGVDTIKWECTNFKYAGTTYQTSDATYVWDISKDGDRSVMAYYFNNNNQGEVFITSQGASCEMISFDDAMEIFNGSKTSSHTAKDYVRWDTYTNYLGERDFVLPDETSVTPWSIIDVFNTATPVKRITFVNYVTVSTTKYLFAGLKNMTQIRSIDGLDTSNVKDMSYTFLYSTALKSVDLSGLDTSKVLDMQNLFNGCTSLTSVNFGSVDTSNVTDMHAMFFNCSSIPIINMQGLDTSSVTDMASMFYGCTSLTSINLTGFDTSNVGEMDSMFMNCSSLEQVDVSMFNTEKVSIMAHMFDGCRALESLDISSFTLRGSCGMNYMFKNCSSLETLDLSNLEIDGQGTAYFFTGCSALSKIILPDVCYNSISLPPEAGTEWTACLNDTPTSTKMQTLGPATGSYNNIQLLGQVIEVETLTGTKIYNLADKKYAWDVSIFDGDKEIMAYYFNGSGTGAAAGETYDGEVLIVSNDSSAKMVSFEANLSESNVTSAGGYETVLTSQTRLWDFSGSPVTPWQILDHYERKKTSGTKNLVKSIVFANDVKVSNGSWLFARVESLENIINLNKVDISSADYMNSMFEGCKNLKSVDLSNFRNGRVQALDEMFNGCESLTSIVFPTTSNQFRTDSVENWYKIFYGCDNLRTLDIRNFQIGNDSYFDGDNFFGSEDTSLEDIYLPLYIQSGYTISLPAIPGAVWQGYRLNGTTKEGGTFTNPLPVASGNLKRIKIVSNTINVNGRKYNPDDALYTWELSSKYFYPQGIMAYYFENGKIGTGAASSTTYQGEVVVYQSNSSAEMIKSTFAWSTFESDSDKNSYLADYPNLLTTADWYTISSGREVYPWAILDWQESSKQNGNVVNKFVFANTVKAGTYCQYMFADLPHLTEIVNLNYLDTSNLETYSGMFKNCSNLTSVDISHFKSNSKATYLDSMFAGCTRLTSVTFPSSDFTLGYGSNVSMMFMNCSSLTSVDISSLDFANASYVYNAFAGCTSLTSVKLPIHILSYEAIALPNLTDGRVWQGFASDGSTKAGGTYTNLPAQTSAMKFVKAASGTITVNDKVYNIKDAKFKWDISYDHQGGVMAYYFNGGSGTGDALGTTYDNEVVVVQNNPLSKVMDFETNANVHNSGSGNSEFSNITNVENYLGKIDYYSHFSKTLAPWSILGLKFSSKYPVESFSFANEVKLSNARHFFACLGGLETIINLDNLNTSGTTSMDMMFFDCAKLTELDLSTFVTDDVTSFSQMFQGLTELETLDLSNWIIQSGANVTEMFTWITYDSTCALSKIMMPDEVNSSLNIDLPTVKAFSVYDANDEIININGNDTVDRLYGKNIDSNASYIATYIPTLLFTDSDGTQYFTSDLYTCKGVNGTSYTGAAKWNISQTGTDNLWAYVFAKKNSNGTVDENNLILVFAGDEENAKQYEYVLEAYVSASTAYTYYSSKSCSQLSTFGIDNIPVDTMTPWTLYVNKSKIKKAVVSEEVDCDCWDAWFDNLSNLGTLTINLKSNGVGGYVKKMPTSLNGTFSNCNLSDASTVLDRIDTSNVTSMACTFAYLKGTSFPWNKIQTSKVTDISFFLYQNKLTTIDTSSCSVDLSKVTTMSNFAYRSTNLTTMDLSGITTSNKLTNISNFVYSSEKLQTLTYGSNINLSGVTNVSSSITWCTALTRINLPANVPSSITINLPTITGRDFYAFDTSGNLVSSLGVQTKLIASGNTSLPGGGSANISYLAPASKDLLILNAINSAETDLDVYNAFVTYAGSLSELQNFNTSFTSRNKVLVSNYIFKNKTYADYASLVSAFNTFVAMMEDDESTYTISLSSNKSSIMDGFSVTLTNALNTNMNAGIKALYTKRAIYSTDNGGTLISDSISTTYYICPFTESNAKTYYVVASLDTSIPESTAASKLTSNNVTLTRLTPSFDDLVFTLDSDTFTYDATSHEPSVTIYENSSASAEILGEDYYEVSYFNNVNAGSPSSTNKPTVTITGIGPYDGEVKELYFTINKKHLDVTVTINDKEYDGTNVATGTATLDSSQIEAGDNPSVSITSATFASSELGTWDVNVNLSLSGTGCDNYEITTPVTKTATITRKIVTPTFTLIANPSKVYDGTDDATSLVSGSLVVNSVSIPFTYTAKFVNGDKNVGTGKKVIIIPELTNASDKLLYSFSSDTYELTGASITPKEITYDVTVDKKTYDGTTNVSQSKIHLTTSGIIDADKTDVSVSCTGVYDSKDEGNSRTITLTLSIVGDTYGNYSIVTSKTLTGQVIDKKHIAYTLTINPSGKVFDGSTDAKSIVTATINSGEIETVDAGKVSLNVKNATFNNANYGDNKPLSIELELLGDEAHNYEITQPSGNTSKITKKLLRLEFAADSKVYDGNAILDPSKVTVTSIKDADGNAVNAPVTVNTATFDNKNVGTGKKVTLEVSFVNTQDASNYSLDSLTLSNNSGVITAKELTWDASVNGKTYDGTTDVSPSDVTITPSGIVSGDDVSVSLASVNYTNKDAGTNTVDITVSKSGTDAGNYTWTDTKQITNSGISKKNIAYTLTIDPNGKVFDGSNDASSIVSVSINSGEVIAADVDKVILSVKSAIFSDDANFGDNKPLSIELELSGDEAKNYSITQPSGKTSKVTKELLILEFTTTGKTYDGTDVLDPSKVTITKITKADGTEVTNVPLTVTSATFDSKNVGTGKTVTITATFDNAQDASNYTISSSSLTLTDGEITAKEIEWTASAASKIYDGTDTVEKSKITSEITNLESCDIGKVSLDLTAEYDDKNVGTGKTVTFTIGGLNGTGAGNYKYTAGTKDFDCGVIEAKKLTYTLTVSGKDFDGTLDAHAEVSNIEGIVSPDVVGINVKSATFSDPGYGTHDVTVVLELTGDDRVNYCIDQPSTQSATISKNLVRIEFNVLSKVYDGTKDAKDLVSINKITDKEGTKSNDFLRIVDAKFEDKNVGSNKVINVTVEYSNPSDADNYDIDAGSLRLSNGEITKLDATYTLSVNPKVYDGNGNITPNDITATITNKVDGDDVSILATGVFDDVNVNESIKVNFNLTLDGSDKDNYNLVNSTPSENIGKITERELEIEVVPNNKDFDGTTLATASVRITGGKVEGDDVNVEVESASFEDSAIGQNKPVNVTVKKAGTKAANYKVTQPAGLTANISNKTVRLVFSTPNSKVYDGTKDATGLVEIVKITDLNDVEITSGVSARIKTATFDSKDAGSNKTIVVVPEFTEGAGNFDFESSQVNVTGGEITKKPLTFNVNVPDKTYDGKDDAEGVVIRNSITGLVSGDNPTITLTNGKYASKDAASDIDVTFESSINDNNYTVSSTVLAKGNIKKKDLHIDATTDDGDYNIGDPITVKFALRESDLVQRESVGLSTSTGSGTVEEGERKVKKVTITSWPELTGVASVTKNYNAVHSECFVNLTRLDLTNERIEITIVSRSEFDGTPKTVDVTVRFPELGVNLIKGTDFEIEYLDSHTDVGNHDIKIKFIGEYKGEKTTSFEIKEKPQPAPEPAPSGGGGGGGGMIYVIQTQPLDDKGLVIPMHKAYMNGYEDERFYPQNKVTREEVATIVARLDSEFNEDYNFTAFNDFKDTDDRWAKNYIGFCKLKDLIHGYEDGSFHPASYMTRAELAVLVNNFLRVQKADTENVDLTKPAFSDVDGKWYEEAVNKLAALGILNGYEDGTFKGDRPVSRVEVVIVMNKINGRQTFDEIPDEYISKITSIFRDVKPDRWFFKDVAEAVVDHPADLY